jgi:hypothetical protein
MTNWAALAAAIGGPVVGGVGLVTAWLTSQGERSHSRQLTESQHEHERTIRREERLFTIRADAYRDALLYTYRAWWLIREDTSPDDFMEALGPGTFNEVGARLGVFGSAEALHAFDEFGPLFRDYWDARRADDSAARSDAMQHIKDAIDNVEGVFRHDVTGE